MDKVKKIIVGCFLIIASSVSAQEVAENQGEKLTLSLEEAQNYALEYNRTIKQQDLSVQKAKKAEWASIASMLPQVSGKVDYNSYLGYELNMFGQKLPMSDYMDVSITASIAVSGMQIVATQLSKLATEMQETNKALTDLQIRSNVATSYYSVLVTEELKRLLEGNMKNLNRLYESTENSYQVGMLEQTDVDQLKVQLGMMKNSILSTQRSIELAYNALRMLLGSSSLDIELTDKLDNEALLAKAYEVLNSNFDLDNNFNVQLLDKNIELSHKNVRLNEWAYGPTLSAFYQYTYKKEFKEGGFNMTPPNVVGVALNIPIFSSGEKYSKVRQSKFDLESAQLAKEDAVEGLLVQEKQLRFNLRNAIDSYELQKQNVDVRDRIFNNMIQKYEYGTVSMTDLTTANNNLISEQMSYVQALLDLVTAQINLQELLNTL